MTAANDPEGGMSSKPRIMIVDDTALVRLILEQVVKSAPDLELVAKAVNGKDALDKLKEAKPDLIMTDIEMPEMDGLTFVRHARLRCRAKIIVLSSIATAGSKAATEAKRLGADAVIAKPMGAATLDAATSQYVLGAIRSQLGMKQAS